MIYPNTFESKIGFTAIKQNLYDACVTSSGKKHVENMSFSSDFDKIVCLVSETEEVRQAILFHSPFPFSEYPECIQDIIHLSIEGTIIEKEVLPNLRSELMVFKDCINYFTKNKDNFPLIYNLWQYDFNPSKLINDINKIVDEKGEIKDNASEKLLVIRQKITNTQKKADKQIVNILKAAKTSGIVKEDCEISIRDGHAVIPVPAANKRLLRGFVHDTSSTGQTLYIEPDEIFDINNEIRELLSEEYYEIINILNEFTILLRPDIKYIIEMDKYLSYIDFLKAKANFAIKVYAFKPIIIDTPNIHFIKAKHPILFLSLQKNKKEVVPLNISLDEENRILVISGPNAGGKSIALKTVALLQYMLQCGMLISANENSEIGVFKDIFIDIGDEQSIENDLSTYTSHLKNLKVFIENANEASLILIDEFGSGTEPQLGGAIAEASLNKLCSLHVKGIITTHYSNLKKLAQEKKGLINGAMLFDKAEMKPLFELSIGKPGSSYTFEIAKRVGFPQNILNTAVSISSSFSQINYDKQLEELEVEKRKLDMEKTQVKVADQFLAEIIEKYTKQLKQIEEYKKNVYKKAQAEAAEIIINANRKIENAIKNIKEANAEKEKTKKIRAKLENELKNNIENQHSFDSKCDNNLKNNNDFYKIPNKILKKLEEIKKPVIINNKPINDKIINEINSNVDINKSVSKVEKLIKNYPDKKQIKIQNKVEDKLEKGCLVTAYNSDTVGTIVEVNNNEAKVDFNSISMVIKLKDLKIYNGTKIRNEPSNESVNSIITELNERAYNFNLNIDVRGMRADEAIYEITHYVDDAIMLGIHNFSILHGRGNGILRKLIRDYLSTVKQVESYEDEAITNGGDGVTVVHLNN